MSTKCVIGSKDEGFVHTFLYVLKNYLHEEMIFIVPDFNDFLKKYKPSADRIIVFADRYYFGFHIENQIYKVLSVDPKTAIVIFDESEFEKGFAFRMHNTGIYGLLDHVITGNDLAARIERIMNGQRVFPDSIAERIALGEHMNNKDCYNAPTVREYQLLAMLSYGRGHKEICSKFNISESMIGTYIERVRNRLGAKTTGEAIRIWLRTKENSDLEDDEYDSFCGWNVSEGVFTQLSGFGGVPQRKMPERHTGVQCRHLQERALEVQRKGHRR